MTSCAQITRDFDSQFAIFPNHVFPWPIIQMIIKATGSVLYSLYYTYDKCCITKNTYIMYKVQDYESVAAHSVICDGCILLTF